jgi:hypothetical protein
MYGFVINDHQRPINVPTAGAFLMNDVPSAWSVRFGVRLRKLSNVGTLSLWSRLYLQLLAPTNPQ